MLKYHALIVHFPIALIISAFMFAIIGLLYRRKFFKDLIFWNLIFGLIASAFAIYTGLIDEKQLVVSNEIKEVLNAHKRNAYYMCSFLLGLTIWLGIRKTNMRFLEYSCWSAFLLIGAVSIGYQGYSGSTLVFKEGVGVKTEPKPKKELPEVEAEEEGWSYDLSYNKPR
jgi:uncharacterized membrane protein